MAMAAAGERWAAALIAVVLLLALLALLFFRGEPAQQGLTEHTRGTGHPLTAEQQSVDFTHADLTFAVDPAGKSIAGRSLLTFAVQKPIERIHFDLERDLPIKRIAVDGKVLPGNRWSNPEGRVTVNLPRANRAGEQLRLEVNYAGKPHVAENAPWSGGFVWSETPDGKPWVATAVQGEGCDLLWPCFDNSLV